MQLVSVDIGGTHARFAIAEVENGRVVSLGEPVTLKTAEHASLQTAWQHFASIHGTPLPKAAALSVASPITGDIIRLTNNPWVIRPSLIPERLGADIYTVIERKGAPTWLLTTKGFRDALEIRREKRFDLYDLALRLPPPARCVRASPMRSSR